MECFQLLRKGRWITPILKKASLDPHDAANYRPISNLSYLSKLLERCVNDQIHNYFSKNDLLPVVQLAYRKHHSTKTAVLKVLSDIYSAADAEKVTLMGLRDLSTAFDTVDHCILFERLEHSYGFGDAVLGWFKSYLTDRSQCISYNGVTSEPLQSSTEFLKVRYWDQSLYLLYSANVVRIATKHGFYAHSYADDLHIYDHTLQTSCVSLVTRMSTCVTEINSWMAKQPSKTQPIKDRANTVLFPAIFWGDSPSPESQIPSQKNTQNTKNIKQCIEFTPSPRYYVCAPRTWSLKLTLELIWLGSSRRLKHCPQDEHIVM